MEETNAFRFWSYLRFRKHFEANPLLPFGGEGGVGGISVSERVFKDFKPLSSVQIVAD